jgi:hypothetical protein
VTDNPNINADKRHMALAAGADGIPLHKDKNASSGTPFVVTAENTPIGAYRKNQHQHMFALAPSEERRYDEAGNAYTFKKDPPSIQCILLLFTNELLHGQDEGYEIRDFSVPPDSPNHVFMLKVILLFFMGDYPGQGKAANMLHSGKQACHWCKHNFESHSPGHNVALGTRQHLPPDSPLRTDPSFGPEERRPPPETRTHVDICQCADEVDRLNGRGDAAARAAAEKRTGVYGWCPLSLLALFNMAWDITGDMMHLIKGMWMRRLIPMLKGELTQAHPKEPSMTQSDGAGGQQPRTQADIARRRATFRKASAEWAKVHLVLRSRT